MSDRTSLPRLATTTPSLPALDDFPWAGAIIFRAYGLTIGIRVTDPSYLGQVSDILPYGWKPTSRAVVEHLYSIVTEIEQTSSVDDGPHQTLYRNETVLASATHRLNVLDELERDLRLLVAVNARRRTFVHAGAVGWRGRAILIPGRSLTGKTTLVAELVRSGATYYSDDFAVLDAGGRVHPFATPLQIRGRNLGPQVKHEVETLGGRAGKTPITVGMIVVTRYQEGAHWRPRRISPGRAMLELLNESPAAHARPQETLAALEAAVSQAILYRGVRAEAADLAPILLDRIAPAL